MQKFISPYVYNVIVNNNIKYEDSYSERKTNLFSKFLITYDRLSKYNNSLYMLNNNDKLKEEVSLLDLIIYCSFLNINLLHIKNVRDEDELYDILIMCILINDSFKRVLLKEVISNLYLQKLIYLALDVRFWIGKSIETLYKEIINNSLTISQDKYYDTYKLVKENYNNYRCSSHSFIVKREIYMMLDKDLCINFLDEELRSNPTSNMFDKCYINGDNDNIYNSISYINSGYLFHNRLQMFNAEEKFFYIKDDLLYYGNEVANKKLIIKGRHQGYLLKNVYEEFASLIDERFRSLYNNSYNEHKQELIDYLNITDEYYLLYSYKYLSREVKKLLSFMIVDDYYLLDDYIRNCHKNIIIYMRKWLRKL